ncbi:Translocation protein [Wickerhamomyces ciferrii]|uniref:Translocation protein n=1 Tax=Wickerhamomyces ciferrii (strain ATCC 14091 / BCRC 22168 / CBS 111 / JCM 3599 / NBRC 0793 / NRRL Y-1031 F-60-10) TaxID=1206466 RepID=K0KSN9_WICCF|nr:Translocation protein [Wickerhamomyces ciferrii]CCH45062.1 Translocation protein [Wickerhamomyces ciferrii]
MADNQTTEQTEQVISKISVFTPIIYVTVVLTALVVFSINYRKNKINALYNRQPFFKRNLPKELHFELRDSDPKPNEKVLKAALLRRGAESIRRTIKLKEVQPFITALYQKGSIGDDLYERYQTATKLEELEVQEIVAETEKYKAGWIPKFVPLLQEICFNEALRRRYSAIEDRKLDLLDQWEIKISKDGILEFPNKEK